MSVEAMPEPGAVQVDDPADHAERQVLGAMMLDALAVDDASRVLRAGDFAHPRAAVLFDAILGLSMAGAPHDWVAVADQLQRSGDLARIGGMAALASLTQGVVAASQAGYYARIVREAATLRAVRAAGARLQQAGESDGPAVEVVAAARAQLDAVIDRAGGDVVSNRDAVDEAMAALDAPLGLDTPWPSLQSLIGGWVGTRLYVFGARPGVGKSLVGIGAAVDCARRGKTAVVFSLEMSRVELYHRILALVSGVDGTRIARRELTAADHAALGRAAEHVKSLPLVVHTDHGLSVPQVRQAIRREQLRGQVGLVVVDYLAKLSAPDTKQDRRVQVDQIVWGLKQIAAQLDVPVIALAQMNRNIESSPGREPQLSDLREAGGIEADADVVVLMTRARNVDEGDPSELRMTVRKNRHGQSDQHVDFVFRGHRSHIQDPQHAGRGLG